MTATTGQTLSLYEATIWLEFPLIDTRDFLRFYELPLKGIPLHELEALAGIVRRAQRFVKRGYTWRGSGE